MIATPSHIRAYEIRDAWAAFVEKQAPELDLRLFDAGCAAISADPEHWGAASLWILLDWVRDAPLHPAL